HDHSYRALCFQSSALSFSRRARLCRPTYSNVPILLDMLLPPSPLATSPFVDQVLSSRTLDSSRNTALFSLLSGSGSTASYDIGISNTSAFPPVEIQAA